MKQGIVNNRWVMVYPDTVADWDAITHWERERFQSYTEQLRWGDLFVDVGTENGWMTALIGREMVGAENLVLIEPSIEMWRNIWLTWKYNDLPDPAGTWVGFVGDDEHRQLHPKDEARKAGVWPDAAIGYDEQDAMAYKSLLRDAGVPSVTLDDLKRMDRIPRKVDAISIDVEGAELLVLRGARDILSRDRPMVWVSIHIGQPGTDERSLIEDFGHTRQQVIDFMDSLGYAAQVLGYQHEEHVLFWPSGIVGTR